MRLKRHFAVIRKGSAFHPPRFAQMDQMCQYADGGSRVQAFVYVRVDMGDHIHYFVMARDNGCINLFFSRQAVVNIGLNKRFDLGNGRAVGRANNIVVLVSD